MMSLSRTTAPLSSAVLAGLRASLLATPPRPPVCSRCLQQIRIQQRSRLSSKRCLATATAVRPQSLDFHSPPRNADVPETSISSGRSAIDTSSSNISLREGEAQKSMSTPTNTQIDSPAKLSSLPEKKPRKSKLRARKAAMTLSPAAVNALRELLDQPEPKLIRVGVKNRGCSGLAYHLEYVDKEGAFDEAVEQDGVKVLIDSKALFSIIGSQMDYVKDKLSQRFVFNNPNITESCGCGESFSVG